MSSATRCFLSPTQAAHIASKLRKAMRAGIITAHSYATLDALLWEARKPGADRVVVAYSWLQKLANVCRQTAVDAIAAGQQLGLLRKLKRKILVVWANGGRQWRQQPNEYVFCCESTPQAEYQKEVVQILTEPHRSGEIRTAQVALADRRRVIEARMLTKKASRSLCLDGSG